MCALRLLVGVYIALARSSACTFATGHAGVLVDWSSIVSVDDDALAAEGAALADAGMAVTVDATSAMNLFPTIRLCNNSAPEYAASMALLSKLLHKAGAVGSRDLLLSLHRFVENNYSPDAALKSFGVTLSALAAEASALGITLHLRQATKNPWAGLVDTAQWCVHLQRCHGAARVRVCCTGLVCACVYILDCVV
jgi:hypothetical protein